MSPLSVTPLVLSGLARIVRQPMGDTRGFLARCYCRETLAFAGWTGAVEQINHTHTARAGTVRGMHLQASPPAEWKLVTCLRGAVWDVALDLRHGSSTFLQWHAEELSASNNTALLIPPGCAHGFQALTDSAELLYVHSAPHLPQREAGFRADDPLFGISWPLPIGHQSLRDATHPNLEPTFAGLDA